MLKTNLSSSTHVPLTRCATLNDIMGKVQDLFPGSSRSLFFIYKLYKLI